MHFRNLFDLKQLVHFKTFFPSFYKNNRRPGQKMLRTNKVCQPSQFQPSEIMSISIGISFQVLLQAMGICMYVYKKTTCFLFIFSKQNQDHKIHILCYLFPHCFLYGRVVLRYSSKNFLQHHHITYLSSCYGWILSNLLL